MPTTRREQLNVPVSERLALTARQVCLAKGIAIPDLLRPVVEEFLEGLFHGDANIRDAVGAIERARALERGADVTDLPTTVLPVESSDRTEDRP